ncbi:MAG: aminotransferase class III-fold pyridoxal phosphate-dependent enzyme [Acidobacteria bacterium]|nr:aminotransferase class III-fold pyridoxal phosphate-dependent enzyme [Acidobacteriota bacterium]
MSLNKEWIDRRLRAVPRGVGIFAGETTAESGHGARLVNADGRELIDFAGGIGVVNAGHCAPEVVEAVQQQAAKLMHACIHVATYEPYVELCEKLNALFPHGGPTKTMLVNTGAEAVENAIKIARQATGRPAIFCYTGAFHGRTMMGMALTSKTSYKLGCGPFAPEVYRLPFPSLFHDGDGLTEAELVRRELQRFEDAFYYYAPADQVAAVILEVVQGEGGFLPVPKGYLQGLREICNRHGILLICDEVQSGFCRTGRWAAYEHYEVTPDLSTWAKSMGSGLPIGAVIGRADVMDAARPGTIGGTYGGNPVACAASLATISVMEKLDLNGRAQRIGARVREAFEGLQTQTDVVADVRGLGAMIGMELCYDGDPHRPAGSVTADALARCRDNGVLVLPAGAHGNIIRTLSPLVIEDADLERALAVMTESILAAAEVAVR